MISKIIETATDVGNDWVDGHYYDVAEGHMADQWTNVIWPIIDGSDFSTTLEVAPGHGRNTAKLLQLAARVYAVDINQTNVDFLNQRFEGVNNLTVIRNGGAELDPIDNASITFVYSFDSMVHFDSDVVRSYIREFRRVMKPGARGFVHYSAYDQNPTGTSRDHHAWRNFMNVALFHHWLSKEGFVILRTEYVAGNLVFSDSPENADAVTYFELPWDAEASIAARPRADELAQRALRERMRQMESSASWRWTAPLRRIRDAFYKRFLS